MKRDIRERGMIFNTEMVLAILDGRKTVTRRPVHKSLTPHLNFMENEDGKIELNYDNPYKFSSQKFKKKNKEFLISHVDYPEEGCIAIGQGYGAVGDQIYVRETWTEFVPEHVFKGKHYAYKANITTDGEEIRERLEELDRE